VGNDVGVATLGVVDPAGAARRVEGQDAVVGEPSEQLGRLLHDREVGGEHEVEALVEADLLHHASHERSDLHVREAVFLGHVGADRGGDEADDDLRGVVDRREDLAAFAHVVEGAGGAGAHALSTRDAVGHVERRAGGRAHPHLSLAELEGKDARTHDLGARGHAQSARDALVLVTNDELVVAHNRGARPHVQSGLEMHLVSAGFLAQRAGVLRGAAAGQATRGFFPGLRLGKPQLDLGETVQTILDLELGHDGPRERRECLELCFRKVLKRAA